MAPKCSERPPPQHARIVLAASRLCELVDDMSAPAAAPGVERASSRSTLEFAQSTGSEAKALRRVKTLACEDSTLAVTTIVDH